FHVGVLLDNVPEFPFWLSAAALVSATVVGIDPPPRGAELARDVTHTDCQLIVTDTEHLALLRGLDLGVDAERVLVSDGREYAERLAPHAYAPLPDAPVDDGALYLLLFTSGTTGAPKAVRCTQGRIAGIGTIVAQMFPLTGDDVCYAAMPMYH